MNDSLAPTTQPPAALCPARARVECDQLQTLIALTKAAEVGLIRYPAGTTPLSCFAGAAITELIADNTDEGGDDGDSADPTGGY